MSALNLPKPVNTYAGEDELRKFNGNGVGDGEGQNGAETGSGDKEVANGDGSGEGKGESATEQEMDTSEYRPPRRSDKFLQGIIYPPKEIRLIVDKTALHIFKSPTPELLEDKIREHQKNDPKFSFLTADDPYYQYYKYMLEKSREDAEDLAKGIVPAGQTAPVAKKEEEITTTAYEPRTHEFRVDLPGVTAHDLDILRLTALFHARRGRSFLSSLSVREGRNYQFDFLRPTHSLYGYYNRMVESYQKVMQPAPGTIETLAKETSDPNARWSILEEGRNRAEWEKFKRRRADIKQKEQDEEADAFAVIDWQDFVLVETIEFTQNDVELNLPPPSSIEQLKNRSMGEKRMASMILEETGAGPTGGIGVQGQGQGQGQEVVEEEMEMDEEEEEEEEEELRLQRIKEEKEQARAREIQRAAMESRGMKIKKDYVSKGITRTGAVATAKCPNCGQSIPENELAEHIRIELLDPRWKEQKRQLDARRQQHLQLNEGADITSSLRSLASARTDLFGDEMDEATRKAKEEEDLRKKKERERIIWDGHTASAAKTKDTFHTQFSLDDQIRHMHQRMGLTEEQGGEAAGPKIGPAVPGSGSGSGSGPQPQAQAQGQGPTAGVGVGAGFASLPPNPTAPQEVPPALAAGASTPGGGTAYEGATISAPPSGPSAMRSGPPSSGGAPPGIHPARAAMMGAAAAGSATPPPSGPSGPRGGNYGSASPAPAHSTGTTIGQTRPAPDSGEYGGGGGPAKRAKVEKLAFGQYSELDWISLHPHPISLSVQLPSMPEKPEWKLDGSIISIPDIPVNTPFSVMRDRIKRAVDADLPISRLQIQYEGKVMSNATTLAGVNIGEGDLIGLVVKKK